LLPLLAALLLLSEPYALAFLLGLRPGNGQGRQGAGNGRLGLPAFAATHGAQLIAARRRT
jgi:hypothetical protein